jgi:hypothetical protein
VTRMAKWRSSPGLSVSRSQSASASVTVTSPSTQIYSTQAAGPARGPGISSTRSLRRNLYSDDIKMLLIEALHLFGILLFCFVFKYFWNVFEHF